MAHDLLRKGVLTMAIWYVDYVNGLDANAGTSWATAYKTLNAVTGAKGFVNGDEIRVARSPAPTSLGQQCQWTDQSKTVTLTNQVTQTLDNCDAVWTKAAATSVSTSSSSQRQGTANLSISVPASVANTLYAYKAISPGDLSAYTRLSCWFQASTTFPAGNYWRLCLCSDNAGQNIVYSFDLPIFVSNTWNPIVADAGTPLSGTIQSIALYSGSNPMASATLQIDNIFACKPVGDDALTILSLISKNTGSEGWFAIQSIDNLTISLDNQVSTSVASTKPYAGVTEKVTTWKRECTRTTMTNAIAQSIGVPANAQVTVSGGWDTITGLQSGDDTWFDGQCCTGTGINFAQSGLVMSFSNISALRYGYAISGGSTYSYSGCSFSGYQLSNNVSYGFYSFYYCGPLTYTNVIGNGIAISQVSSSFVKVTNFIMNTSSASMNVGAYGNTVQMTTCRNNVSPINPGFGWRLDIINSNFSNNGGSDIGWQNNTYAPIFLKNTKCQSVSFGSNQGDMWEPRVYSHNDGQVVGAEKIWSDYLTIVNDTSTVRTAGGMSWKISPTNAVRNSGYPGWLTIAKIFCPANQQRTFKAWFRRDNVGITGQLVVRGGRINGIPDNVTDTMTAAANTWDQRSITVTPAEDAVIEVEAWAYGGTTYNVWVTEFSAS